MGNCSKLVFLRENIELTNKNTILIMLNIIIQRKYNLISFYLVTMTITCMDMDMHMHLKCWQGPGDGLLGKAC